MQNATCDHLGCINTLVPSSSLVLLFPSPYYHCHVYYFSPSCLAFLLPHTQLPVMVVGSLVMMVVMIREQHGLG